MNLIVLDINFNNENGFHVQWWETCKITNIAFSKWTSIVTYHECYWLETYFLSWALFLGIFMAFFSVQYRLIIKWMWIIFVTNVAMLLKTDFTLFEFSSTFISFAILANLDISNIYIISNSDKMPLRLQFTKPMHYSLNYISLKKQKDAW